MRPASQRWMIRAALSAMLVTALPFNAYAGAVVYSQFPLISDPTAEGFTSNLNDPGSTNQTADNFTLDEPADISEVAWFGNFFRGTITFPQEFTIRFWSGSGGIPGSIVSQSTVDVTGTDTGLRDQLAIVFSYEAPVSLDLPAGDYWLSILESDVDTDHVSFPGFVWQANVVEFGDRIARRDGESGTWATVTSAERAFELRTVVPEPSSMSLLLIAVLAASLRAFIKRHCHKTLDEPDIRTRTLAPSRFGWPRCRRGGTALRST